MLGSTKENKEALFIKISVVFLVIIISSGLIFIVLTQKQNQENIPAYTMNYQDITPEEAYDFINKSRNIDYNLTIIDCRGLEGCSSCQFSKGHLPGATLNQNYETLYNYTIDILVYSKDGGVGATFCQNLTGHVYGAIYNLEGGYEAWSSNPIFPTK